MTTISDTIKTDHRELEAYYDKIINPKDQDEQVRYQNQFTWELARHSIDEELVVYPALEKYVKGGKALADKDREEHQVEEEEDLVKLESALREEESKKLATSFSRTKTFVPTRSHPSAPDKPPFETAVGLLTAPIDDLADLFRKFPDKTLINRELHWLESYTVNGC
ncbi:hypothetical protein RJ035_001842 [Blastomyces gilchristii]